MSQEHQVREVLSGGGKRRITIDPITRLEGHGKIEIFLDGDGNVERAYFQVPELRGFEKFSVGRPAEDMPQITSRICGVCPTAHHMAGTRALDDLYKIEPPPAAHKIRELVYNTFMLEDHALHFYFLGGPDFVVGPQAPAADRNVLGVIAKVGEETGLRVIKMRRRLRELIGATGGKVVHPVMGLPGGVAKRLKPQEQARFKEVADEGLEFAKFTLKLFEDVVLAEGSYVDLILSDAFTHRTYYMGLVDENNHVNFYRGKVRVVSPQGEGCAMFDASEYAAQIAEHVEPWSYVKFCYLKPVGWNGFSDGEDSGIYCVAPLARLNVADGMATPLAQAAYEQYFETLGGKPVHHTLANHWARVIEMLYAAERMQQLAHDDEITSDNFRVLPTETPVEGVGVVEAPRGTLFHHYRVDDRDRVTMANLIVSTTSNNEPMNRAVEGVARQYLDGKEITEGLLNHIEVAVRAYDPCLSCATHALGQMPLILDLLDADGNVIDRRKKG